MRLVTYAAEGVDHAAVLTEQGILPVRSLAPGLPDSLTGLIDAGQPAVSRLRQALEAGGVAALDPASVRLRAPLPNPRRNIFCVGKNYVEHAGEFQGSGFDSSSAGEVQPEVPILFTKATTSVIGPEDPVLSSLDPTGTLDYEGELAVVIGTAGRGISKAEALSHVFGYTIVNDVTARATQKRHKQWFLGKSPDTFCPMGPAILTADAVPDLGALRLVTRVNGEVRQSAPVSDLIFDVPTIIETLSAATTLLPGDIIATGTPAGVALGFTPPRFLKPGDRVEVEIDGIGVLANPIA